MEIREIDNSLWFNIRANKDSINPEKKIMEQRRKRSQLVIKIKRNHISIPDKSPKLLHILSYAYPKASTWT